MDQPLHAYEAVLDVGAGGRRRAPHVTTMDRRRMTDTDVTHDANQVPWPFEDNQFDYIILSHVLEHLDDISAVLAEVRRVGRPGALVRCICPHFTNPCSYVDVTHRHALSVLSLDIFCVAANPHRSPVRSLIKKGLGCDMCVADAFRENEFILQRRSLYFREVLWPILLPVWGNLWQEFYEVYVSRLFPAWAIYWELQVVK